MMLLRSNKDSAVQEVMSQIRRYAMTAWLAMSFNSVVTFNTVQKFVIKMFF